MAKFEETKDWYFMNVPADKVHFIILDCIKNFGLVPTKNFSEDKHMWGLVEGDFYRDYSEKKWEKCFIFHEWMIKYVVDRNIHPNNYRLFLSKKLEHGLAFWKLKYG